MNIVCTQPRLSYRGTVTGGGRRGGNQIQIPTQPLHRRGFRSALHGKSSQPRHRFLSPLPWRHNELGGVWNHQDLASLLNRLSRRGSKKASKLRVAGLCAWNSPVTGEFPSQRTSHEENVSIRWRHHAERGIDFKSWTTNYLWMKLWYTTGSVKNRITLVVENFKSYLTSG